MVARLVIKIQAEPITKKQNLSHLASVGGANVAIAHGDVRGRRQHLPAVAVVPAWLLDRIFCLHNGREAWRSLAAPSTEACTLKCFQQTSFHQN